MILCADIGNSGIRIGAWQVSEAGSDIPMPCWRKSLRKPVDLERDLAGLSKTKIQWGIASVNAPLLKQLTGWIQEHRSGDSIKLIRRADVPLKVDVINPDRVGIDRLISSWAAWKRNPGLPAIVVDAGSAVTIDLVDAEGQFAGGNIFPGTSGCLRSLSENTDQLPQLENDGEFPKAPFGRSTAEAIRSGVYRMQAASISSIVRQLQEFAGVGESQILMTGGGIPALLSLLPPWEYAEHLIVDGIHEILQP